MRTAAIDDQVAAAAALLRAGGVVAFPTETVYGLGADVSNSSAVRRIFEIKGRPVDHPLIVHIADAAQLPQWTRAVPDSARRLAERFWPGPLTLILARSRHVPPEVTGGQDTVGLRVPDHPLALALLRALGPARALAAPSANRFGRISPTTAAHVRTELDQAVDLILDGGPCRIGLESTIVGFDGDTASVLRPGGIPLAALAEVLDGNVTLAQPDNHRVRVPGALASHYAPATPLEVWPGASLWQRARELAAQQMRLAVITRSPPADPDGSVFFHLAMPQEATAYARQLYATLRRFDDGRFDRLLVEAPPDHPAWLAIADRLRRAASLAGKPASGYNWA